MEPNYTLPHIVVPMKPQAEPFTSVFSGRERTNRDFVTDHKDHGNKLKNQYNAAWAHDDIDADEDDSSTGTLITFVTYPDVEINFESLESSASGEQPQIVAVREVWNGNSKVLRVTVHIPSGKKQFFLDKVESYLSTVDDDNPRNKKLLHAIDSIRKATVQELWTDPMEHFPSDSSKQVWWEVWLRSNDGSEKLKFDSFVEAHGLRTSDTYLGFDDRIITLICASVDQLSKCFKSIDDIAELRRPRQVVSAIPVSSPSDQQEYAKELGTRTVPASEDAPAVCILDRGVQRTHPLLSHSINPHDLFAPESIGHHDPVIHDHGTEMAGLALYNDLESALLATHPIELLHRLESVKILPDKGTNRPDLYGAITAQGVDLTEIQSADKRRVFMLAVTAQHPGLGSDDANLENSESGAPTSWSASVDALAFGRSIDTLSGEFTYLDREERSRSRLFVISAGNIRDLRPKDNYLDRCDAESVEDPSQAWNAITVGAYSAKDEMKEADPIFAGYVPVAERGELSPASRTSVSFDRKRWPFKPEVVADGGNYARDPGETTIDSPPNLAIVTTRLHRPGQGQFVETRDTSAAAAQVAAIAASISAKYPDFSPETIRALVVHSARWTDAMKAHFDPKKSKENLSNLLRRYGMGVPSLERALYSAANSLTLVSESTIKPFETPEGSSSSRTREMNLHALPWPSEVLEGLSDDVSMRVTLSYFVEPNPSRRGWVKRYSYQSHGLRFAVRRPEESVDDFRRRINKRERSNGTFSSGETDGGWLFGPRQQQSPGSLHTDIWTGSASDLARKEFIAVYPVSGWWKFRKGMDQSSKGVDYSLVVSIDAPKLSVDLYHEVKNKIGSIVEV
ncbi:S8 family peptidase [Corynebacterium suedekumii]|uniref:S8 family peptidase n=1 Tax=Corynebacterium suedekumii TaxID=3049801 RepID=A0ABY8VKQ3_9CORY|nr:S8 family peptidase [Corynebacterium suedekumii]WIM70224.1 S8 family peptidase [Corynebacterium suedekumii]